MRRLDIASSTSESHAVRTRRWSSVLMNMQCHRSVVREEIASVFRRMFATFVSEVRSSHEYRLKQEWLCQAARVVEAMRGLQRDETRRDGEVRRGAARRVVGPVECQSMSKVRTIVHYRRRRRAASERVCRT